jgi:membrane fusion protein
LAPLRVLIVDEPAQAPKTFQPKTMCGLGNQPPALLETHATLPEFQLAASLRPTEPGTRPAPALAAHASSRQASTAEAVRVVNIIVVQHEPAPTARLDALPPMTLADAARATQPPLTAADEIAEPVAPASAAPLDLAESARAEAAALQALSAEQQTQTVGAGTPALLEEAFAAAPPLQRSEPASRLFRQQAVLAYERGEKLASVLKLTTPPSWAFFAAVLTGLFAAISFGVVGKMDVTGRGRGILRSPGGAQTLSAAIGGTVQRLYVHSGDKVSAGQLLVTLDATALRAELQQAMQNLEFVQKRLAELTDHRELHERSLELLRTEAGLTQRRLRSEGDTLQTLTQRSAAYHSLGERGFVARTGVDEIREQMRNVERGRLALEQELAQTQLQQVLLQRERNEQLQRARADLDAAQSKRSALEAMLAQTSVRAPSTGRVEGLDARIGDQVQLGQPLVTLVPVTPPTQVVVFAEDRDRAFLRIGSPARLEVDQLPVAEFGVLTGKVSSIGAHFASLRERQTTLGEEPTSPTPCYRVEVQLAQTAKNRALLERLGSGALVSVRFSLRQRRLITLVLEPLHALLDRKD